MWNLSGNEMKWWNNDYEKGGKNYRNALKTVKKGQKINIEAEKSRFGCNDTDSDDILDARKALHWHELGSEIMDTNLRLFSLV